MGELVQLAVAPVFLLVAIGSLLNVVTGRLGRVVDRARALEEKIAAAPDTTDRTYVLGELRSLERRMTYCHWSINFFSVAALIVALLVATVFIADTSIPAQNTAISVLFITAVFGIILGMGYFIAEVSVATRTVHVRSEFR